MTVSAPFAYRITLIPEIEKQEVVAAYLHELRYLVNTYLSKIGKVNRQSAVQWSAKPWHVGWTGVNGTFRQIGSS